MKALANAVSTNVGDCGGESRRPVEIVERKFQQLRRLYQIIVVMKRAVSQAEITAPPSRTSTSLNMQTSTSTTHIQKTGFLNS